jgi:hypothetical protein
MSASVPGFATEEAGALWQMPDSNALKGERDRALRCQILFVSSFEAVNIFLRDYVHRHANACELLLLFRDRRKLDIHQIFQADIGEVAGASVTRAGICVDTVNTSATLERSGRMLFISLSFYGSGRTVAQFRFRPDHSEISNRAMKSGWLARISAASVCVYRHESATELEAARWRTRTHHCARFGTGDVVGDARGHHHSSVRHPSATKRRS